MAAGGTIPRMTMNDNQVYTIMQDIVDSPFSQVASSSTFRATAYRLVDLDQAVDLIQVFDQYRIDEIEVTFRPNYTANPLGVAADTLVPLLYTTVDYDDAVAPTSVPELRAKSNCTESMYETVVRRFVPHVGDAVWAGSSGFQRGNAAHRWIDCAAEEVEHYGLKYGCSPGNSGQTVFQTWVVSTRYKISFKNIR